MVDQDLFFKLEEEETPSLLLHLPALFADGCIFGSAAGLGCWLVVGVAQAVQFLTGSELFCG